MSSNRTSLQFEIVDGIARLTLNGPPKNEMDIDFFDRFSTFAATRLEGLRADGLIIEGAGRHFSSGARVPEIEEVARQRNDTIATLLQENIASFLALQSLPLPVVAVIRGCCLGAGMELALACRYRIAEKNAVFALPEVTYNLMPGCGGTIRLPRLIDRGKAVELILSGRSMLADEALGLGLVDQVVKRGRGREAAIALIRGASAKENAR